MERMWPQVDRINSVVCCLPISREKHRHHRGRGCACGETWGSLSQSCAFLRRRGGGVCPGHTQVSAAPGAGAPEASSRRGLAFSPRLPGGRSQLLSTGLPCVHVISSHFATHLLCISPSTPSPRRRREGLALPCSSSLLSSPLPGGPAPWEKALGVPLPALVQRKLRVPGKGGRLGSVLG